MSDVRRQKSIHQQMLQRQLGPPTTLASPTDNIMSPCSQKLNAHKNRFVAGTKATKLNFADLR